MAYYRVTKKQEGGGSSTEPTIVFAGCDHTTSHYGSVSYTFTNDGTYQYYVHVKHRSSIPASNYVMITLGSTTLTPTYYNDGTNAMAFYYGEINASENDILTVTTTGQSSAGGIEMFVMKNCDISAFTLVGYRGNDTNMFDINLGGKPYLQVFQTSFNSTSNISFKYGIMDYVGKSVSIPNISDFYYGFTYVITIVSSS